MRALLRSSSVKIRARMDREVSDAVVLAVLSSVQDRGCPRSKTTIKRRASQCSALLSLEELVACEALLETLTSAEVFRFGSGLRIDKALSRNESVLYGT
jgi:hypothetical protein